MLHSNKTKTWRIIILADIDNPDVS